MFRQKRIAAFATIPNSIVMATSTEASRKRPAEEPEAPSEMPRIRTDPIEVAIHEAKQAYPMSADRLAKIEKAACKLPPVPKAIMNGPTVSFASEDWLEVSSVASDITVWGPSPDYSNSPGAKNVAKAKIGVNQRFADWFMALWNSILDAIVAANGGPALNQTASKKVKAKLDAAKTDDEKRAIVAEAHKIHCPLKDGILTVKVKLIADGQPGENDAAAVESFPPLTQEEFKKGGFQVDARPMKARDGTTSIPLDRVIEPTQGRPIFVGQVRFELALKSTITPDGGKRICVLRMSVDFQLLSMKQSDAAGGEAMPNLADL